MSQTYRWNVAEHTAGYDASAEVVHPYYRQVQEAILNSLSPDADADFLLVDLGGGSGRLAERFLARFGQASALVVDQSEPFLDLARQRLSQFGNRADFLQLRLQDEWSRSLARRPAAIVSTSAIHHLEPNEKRSVYQQAFDALAPAGQFINGDEFRPADDGEYLAAMQKWWKHMQEVMSAGRVHPAMMPMLEQWADRNIRRFQEPRKSGDDCHQTIEAQLAYLREIGFARANIVWQQDLWAVMVGIKN